MVEKGSISDHPKCVIIRLITHLDGARQEAPDIAYPERSGHSERRAAPASGRRSRKRAVGEHSLELLQPAATVTVLMQPRELLSVNGAAGGGGSLCLGTGR